jgi:hypothetical protein
MSGAERESKGVAQSKDGKEVGISDLVTTYKIGTLDNRETDLFFPPTIPLSRLD